MGYVDEFKTKLKVFKYIFIGKKLIHFSCCEVIKTEYNNDFNFEHCITHLMN